MDGRATSANEHRTTLTETQRALLRTAAREGYFGVPREFSLSDLAERQSLSSREASEQLRRGLEVVVRETVLED